MKFSIKLAALVFPLSMSVIGSDAASQEKPNILIIMGDDATYNDLPLYGGTNLETPHIDQLAEEGMTFNNAYLSIAMSAPCRAELYTGMYPARNGVCWNHTPARSENESIVQHLGDLGNRVGIAGKIHASPNKVFPFEKVPGVQRGCVSKTAKYDDAGMRKFITRDEDQPFCLATCLVVPHGPWTVGDPSHFDPDELKLPPNIVDTKKLRKEFT